MSTSFEFNFPKTIEGYVEEVPMFRTPVREPDRKQMEVLGKVFKVEGEIVDEGDLYAIRSENSILHQFHASESIRWLSNIREPEEETKVLEITEPKELQAIADEFLAAQNLLDKRARMTQIIFGQAVSSDDASEQREAVNTCAYVNYTYSLEGLPLLGPGAKIQVVIGHDGQVIGCYRFWREVKKGELTKKILGIDTIRETFRDCPGFAQLMKGSRVVVNKACLGYLTLPPSDFQGALIPVIEFRGFVSTRAIERAGFIRSLIAIEFTEEELKRYSVFNKHFDGPCKII